MSDDTQLQIGKLRQAKELLIGCLDLLLDNISGPEWLTKLGKLANCNSVSCIWWPAGQPEAELEESFGPAAGLSVGTIRGLDQLLAAIAPDEPGLVDELAEAAGIRIVDSAHLPFAPDQLVVCLDWHAACVLLIFRERKVAPNWEEYDRERIRELLPIIQRSVAIKKRLSTSADAIELSEKINDESSRGFITLMPDSRVIATNLRARTILGQLSPIKQYGGKLQFCEKQLQIEFEQQLATIAEASESALSDYRWYRNIGNDLLLTMQVFCMETWRRESSRHSSTIVISLEQMQLQAAPAEEQLREFYNLTKAQARLVKQLTFSSGVEEAANALNISVNTARTHLRAIYDRVGVSNKAQLLQRIGSTVAGRVTGSE